MDVQKSGRVKLGRPVLFDQAMQATCCALVRAGWSRLRAALVLGVSPSTVSQLAARDLDFRKRLMESEAGRVLTPEEVVLAASRRSWRAAAWLLERQRAGPRGRPLRRVLRELLTAMKKDAEPRC